MPSAVKYYTERITSSRAYQEDQKLKAFAEKVGESIMNGRLTLEPFVDENTAESSTIREAYRKMIRSSVVKAALLGKIFAVSASDMNVIAASEDARDVEIAAFTESAYTRKIDGGFLGIAETILLTGLVEGTSISEKVWYPEPELRGKWRGKRFFKALKDKDNVQPKVDEFKNIKSIASVAGFVKEWDPTDFVIFRNLQFFKGPGMSELRAAYFDWWTLDTVKKLRTIHLEKFTSPYVDAEYSDEKERPRLIEEMKKLTARSWIVHPDSVQIKAMQLATSGASEFAAAVKDLEQSIALAISGAFLQMLTATGGGGDMRGDAGTQQSTSQLFIWRLGEVLCECINKQMTPALVDENYSLVDEYPIISLGGVNYSELFQAIKIDKEAQLMGAQLSKKAFARKYSLQLATDPTDILTPAPPPSPFGGGFPGGGFGSNPSPSFPAFSSIQDRPGLFTDFEDDPRAAKIEKALERAGENPGGDIALAGVDGKTVEKLLKSVKEEGLKTFSSITEGAVKRLLSNPMLLMKTKRLYSPDELIQLSDMLGMTVATGELLGRARIRDRADEAKERQGQGKGNFSERPTRFRAFARPIKPKPPREALDYFLNLYPGLSVDPQREGPLLERKAFTLATITDETLLNRVQGIIAKRLRTGRGISTAPADIDEVLEQAGVSNKNPQYSEMVVRTNLIDSYNTGAQRELSAVSDTFPVWMYTNPDDERSRAHHADRNGKYYPSSIPFIQVRGTEPEDACNDRCSFIPIDKWEWAKLLAAGATLEMAA